MPNSPDIPVSVRQLAADLAEPRPMRRGSVSVRYVKCSKPRCPCAERTEARHGPYVSVVRVVGGRTHSRWVRGAQVDTLRRQVEAGQRFRKQVEAYWQACERWADAELEAPLAGPHEEGKKKPSARPSKPSSSRKSKRS